MVPLCVSRHFSLHIQTAVYQQLAPPPRVFHYAFHKDVVFTRPNRASKRTEQRPRLPQTEPSFYRNGGSIFLFPVSNDFRLSQKARFAS